MDDSCWFEKIPLDEFDEDKSELITQLRATKWSSKIQFYRKVREPRDVQDLLKHMKGNHLVWMNEESFILLKKLPKSVPNSSKLRKAAANIDFELKSLYVYGVSDNIVARSIAGFLLLKDGRAEEVRIGTEYNRATDAFVPTTFIKPRFLQKYFETNPQRRFVLGQGCFISKTESVALASHPDPLNLGVECRFTDYGEKFVETLAGRTNYFGTLTLYRRSFEKVYTSTLRSSPQVMSEVSQIALNTTSSILRRSHLLAPLTSKARRVEYELRSAYFDEIDSLDIVPRAVTLVFKRRLPRFHTKFLQASGDLRELGIIYDVSYPPDSAQRNELLGAIRTNSNLHLLELGCLDTLGTFWEALLEVIGSHGNLRTVVFWVRHRPDYWAQNDPNLHQLETLVPFMKEHIHLDISLKCRGQWKGLIDSKVETIIEPVSRQNRAKRLTHEPPHDRPALFGAALTIWAAGDVAKTCALLNENTDLLCSLIGQPPSPPSTSSEQRAETRKRNTRSSHNEKNKHFKVEH